MTVLEENQALSEKQFLETFLRRKKNLKEHAEKYTFDCNCQGKSETSKRGKGVLYKNNLQYWYCSHDPKNGKSTEIPKRLTKGEEWQQKKEQAYIQHGINFKKLLEKGILDNQLNFVVSDRKVKKIVETNGKLRFFAKGLSKAQDGAFYSVKGKNKERLYIFAGEWDLCKAIEDDLTCTSPIFGEGVNVDEHAKRNLDEFSHFREVVIVYDNDISGQNDQKKVMGQLTPKLLGSQIGYINIPQEPSVKDYCDYRLKHSLTEFLKLTIHWAEQLTIPQKPTATPPPGEAFGHMPDTVTIPQKPTATPKTIAKPKIERLQSLLEEELLPTNWAVNGIICEGVNLLAGPPKIGKSMFALNIGLSIALGKKALGEIEVNPGNVLYCALEGGKKGLKNRVQEILKFEPEPIEIPNFDYCIEWGGFPEIEQWLKTHPKAKLVIIDTLAKIKPRQQRNQAGYDHDYETIKPLATLAEKYSVAILILHHTRKAEAIDTLEEISGSFGLSGAADGCLVLKRTRGKADAILKVTGREIEEKELALEYGYPCWKLLGDATEYKLSQERQNILQILRENKAAMSPKEVASCLQQKSLTCNASGTQRTLNRMLADGIIKQEGHGKYIIVV